MKGPRGSLFGGLAWRWSILGPDLGGLGDNKEFGVYSLGSLESLENFEE